jgi:hypothetical protein
MVALQWWAKFFREIGRPCEVSQQTSRARIAVAERADRCSDLLPCAALEVIGSVHRSPQNPKRPVVIRPYRLGESTLDLRIDICSSCFISRWRRSSSAISLRASAIRASRCAGDFEEAVAIRPGDHTSPGSAALPRQRRYAQAGDKGRHTVDEAFGRPDPSRQRAASSATKTEFDQSLEQVIEAAVLPPVPAQVHRLRVLLGRACSDRTGARADPPWGDDRSRL